MNGLLYGLAPGQRPGQVPGWRPVIPASRARQEARRAERHVAARSDEGLLSAVIDEVIYCPDTDGEILVSVTVRPASDGGP